MIVNTVIAGTICILLTNLILFHIYIKYKGLTTYEYMIRKKIVPDNRDKTRLNASTNKAIPVHHDMTAGLDNLDSP